MKIKTTVTGLEFTWKTRGDVDGIQLQVCYNDHGVVYVAVHRWDYHWLRFQRSEDRYYWHNMRKPIVSMVLEDIPKLASTVKRTASSKAAIVAWLRENDVPLHRDEKPNMFRWNV